jgi:hypothetical protein
MFELSVGQRVELPHSVPQCSGLDLLPLRALGPSLPRCGTAHYGQGGDGEGEDE